MNNESYNKIFQVKYFTNEDNAIEESCTVESNLDLFKEKLCQIFNLNKNILDKLDIFVINNENERILISNNDEYMDSLNVNEFLINIELKKKENFNNSNNETLLELVDNMKLPNFENIENIPNVSNNFLENTKINIKKSESKDFNNNKVINNNQIQSNKNEEENNKQFENIEEKINKIIEKNNSKIINLINENVNKKFENLYEFLENKFKSIIEDTIDKKMNSSLKNINENLNKNFDDIKKNIENLKKDINNNIENKLKINKDSILINEETEKSESFYNNNSNYYKKRNYNKYRNYSNKNNNYKNNEKKDNNNKLNESEDEKEKVNETDNQLELKKSYNKENNIINENKKEINNKIDNNKIKKEYSVEFFENNISLKTLKNKNYQFRIRIKNNGNEDWPKNCVLCCNNNDKENEFYFVDTEINNGKYTQKNRVIFIDVEIIPPKKIDKKNDFYFINYEIKIKGEEPLIKNENNIGTICIYE